MSSRAPSCTIYLQTSPRKLGSGQIEQTMSSQEHFHYYGKWWIGKSTIDYLLQVTHCFLTTSFYHNIPLISLQSGRIDPIWMES
jgi:hypothetical protein